MLQMKLTKLFQIGLAMGSGVTALLVMLLFMGATNAYGAPLLQNPTLSIAKQGTSNWEDRIKLVFTNTVAETLTDFPVLVVLSSARINYANTQNAGQDIRFVDADGTLLPHEIEQWNENGLSYVWVKVPVITAASTTDYIWLYYNNPTAPDGQNPAAVWPSAYQGVWHFNNSTDNSLNADDAEASTVSYTPAGRIAGGIEFDNAPDYVNMGSSSRYDDIFANGGTLMAWINPRTFGANGQARILEKSENNFVNGDWQFTDKGWSFKLFDYLDPNAKWQNTIRFELGFSQAGADNELRSGWYARSNSIVTDTWQLVAVTYNAATTNVKPTIYVNGVTQPITSDGFFAGEAVPAPLEDLVVGNLTNYNEYTAEDLSFYGRMDEVRVQTTARSANWILAQYRSMTDNFIGYRSSEPVNEPAGGIMGAPFTYTLTVSNSSGTPASNVQIHDTLPAGANYLSGGELISNGDVVSMTITSVPANAAQTTSFVVTSCQHYLVNDDYQINSPGTPVPGPTQFSLLEPPTLTADFQISLNPATVGQTINFTDTSTTNGGPFTRQWNFGDGNTAQGATTSHAYSAAGSYIVTLTLTDVCGYTATAQKSVQILPQILGLTKSVQPQQVTAGQRLTYTVVITNNGLDPLTGLVISDTLPAEVTLVPGSIRLTPAGIGTVGNPPALVQNLTINGGQRVTVTFAATTATGLAHGLVITNTASVTGAAVLVSPTDSATATVIGVPGISLAKTGPDTAVLGQSLVFTFTVTNRGGLPLQIQSISDDVTGTPQRISGDTNGNNFLDLTETWLYTAGYVVPSGAPSRLVNTARITAADTFNRQVTASARHTTTIRFQPALTITKSGPITARVGQLVTFNFAVSHDAALSDRSPITGVTVTDDFAGPASYSSGDDGDGWLEWGETWQFSASYVIAATTPNPFTNVGLAAGQSLSGQVISATAQHTTQLSGFNPKLFVDQDGPTRASPGERVEFVYTVINVNMLSLAMFGFDELMTADIGDGSPMSDVTVTDTVAGPAVYVSGDFNSNNKLDAAEAWVFSAAYTITESDNDPLVSVSTARALDAVNRVVIATDTVTIDLFPEIYYLPVIFKNF